MKRNIIRIDVATCNGCGACIPNCPEGAIQIIDGKARLISDLFCDGLGACIGHCPQAAITVESREAQPYDERAVMENVIAGGVNVITAHLRHLREHGQVEYARQAEEVLREKNIRIDGSADSGLAGAAGCPGTRMLDRRSVGGGREATVSAGSELRQWPVQLKLVPVTATFFDRADLVVAADCVPFAHPDFHRRFLRGRVLVVFCPKLDQAYEPYVEKLAEIFRRNEIRLVTLVHMEVPCCFGLVRIGQEALERSGKKIPVSDRTVTLSGDVQENS
ncbi:MAG: 4Fe-4S binding protein [Candidatus Omnitrophica bacterium]|nr:4Fe-4S binding protein [Candidatus Omnitrophota bacterium]